MASTASTSASARAASSSRQAGPLPRKVGELGFTESRPSDTDDRSPTEEHMQEVDLAERHPADRDYAPPVPAAQSSTSLAPSASPSTAPSAAAASSIPPKSRGFLYRLTSCHAQPLFWGLQGCTLIRLLVILLLIGATIGGWVFTVMRLNAQNAKSDNNEQPPQLSSDGSASDGTTTPTVLQMSGAMFIFIHVAFGVGLLLELVFLERAIFQLRAERWRFLHPGQALPMHRGGSPSNTLGIAPWNRPPLPTYAAALGFRGTGDIEDEAIAVPPPPAYGNTRGSTLLLASFMPAALRRAGSSASTRSSQTQRASRPPMETVPQSRPASYASTNDEAIVRHEARRARQLELALARLEEGGPDTTQ